MRSFALVTVTLCFWLNTLSPSVGDDVAFRRHVLNAESEFSACAVIDVDHDGRPEIVSGQYCYEPPDWQRHTIREVQLIRGRYDDYSNLPLDVNGDGWMDLVSCNYRSSSLYWVRNPGETDSLWSNHVIDTPGPSETGRLADIDGDGQLDVLPSGTKFAAWYEVVMNDTAAGEKRPHWIRHDLPEQLIAHGVGCGDINGDGRDDLVNPRGWAEAPEDPRTGRWIWHGEFNLHRDVGLPILVVDVDNDGDNDLVWGRGHDTGLYWTEQTRSPDAQRVWVRHAIDTSWSQAHSIMLADIDGDDRQDLVAGKRYMGHDGKDPGEYDPLAIYWYRFCQDTKTWERHLVSWGDDCGFDLDPKCADVDQDGDVDIVAPARSGLFLLENLRIASGKAEGKISSELPPVPMYEDHSKLLEFQDAAGELQPVQSPWDWGIRRQHVLWNMQQVMGPLPEPQQRVPVDVQVIEETDTPNYVRRKITYASEPGDRVPAFLLVPKKISSPTRAMLCLHPTSPLGKAQVCGLGGKPSRFYAHELAERGYVCLAPDYPSFGDYDYDFATGDSHCTSGTMKGIWNHIRGIDVLESLPEVAADRIGCIGHSLGGHNALFASAFDQRIRAVVTSCGFNAFRHYYEGDLTGWSSDRYMPRIREQYGCDPAQMPFDFHEVVAAIAPRPLFINAPLHDSNFAVVGVEEAVAGAGEVYQFRNAEKNLHVVYPDAEHDFPDTVRESVYQWLDANLK
jgi:dienelactone hydrolase